MMVPTVERARGRWREILPLLGVETRFLTNKHGPCPLCGGKDRYRFDDKEGDGTYFCNQCSRGTGLILLRKLHGWDHKTACDEVDKILGDVLARSPTPSPGQEEAACALTVPSRSAERLPPPATFAWSSNIYVGAAYRFSLKSFGAIRAPSITTTRTA